MDTQYSEQASVSVGRQGRVVIPARMRQELGIGEGDELVARLEEGRVVLEKRQNVLERVRRRFSVSRGGSLADELIAERREEAQREEREGR